MTAADGLPPLREVIAAHGLAAKKSLGQNFLLDLNLTAKIARQVSDLENSIVVEVGPGPGGLTRALLGGGALRVIAVERDRRCEPALDEIAARYPGRLDVHFEDALAVDWPALLSGLHDNFGNGPAVRIAANLPYNVATPLLTGWLETEPWPPWWASMTLMFQREVADRIVAGPGGKAYGRLSVLAGWRTTCHKLFDIPPSAFSPPPKVTSTVVGFLPRARPLDAPRQSMARVTAAAFGQRRKMLRASLRQLVADPEPLIKAAGLEPTMRAEQVPVDGFAALANGLARQTNRDKSPSGDETP
jgi:16S rRNA (adenine1518-N6/adenine1519-N6)-dimethyltransferase